MQDGNFNVLGAADAWGALAERYEYTPYGRRTVYSHDWLLTDYNDDGEVDVLDQAAISNWLNQNSPPAPDRLDFNGSGKVDIMELIMYTNTMGDNDGRGDDPLVLHPRLDSAGGQYCGTRQLPVGICDFGHQGLLHDKEFGLIHNRARCLHPTLGRFLQRDPLGYVDGMGLYEYEGGQPVVGSDPAGLWYDPPKVVRVIAGWKGQNYGLIVRYFEMWGEWWESRCGAYARGQRREWVRFVPLAITKKDCPGLKGRRLIYEDGQWASGFNAGTWVTVFNVTEEILRALPGGEAGYEIGEACMALDAHGLTAKGLAEAGEHAKRAGIAYAIDVAASAGPSGVAKGAGKIAGKAGPKVGKAAEFVIGRVRSPSTKAAMEAGLSKATTIAKTVARHSSRAQSAIGQNKKLVAAAKALGAAGSGYGLPGGVPTGKWAAAGYAVNVGSKHAGIPAPPGTREYVDYIAGGG